MTSAFKKELFRKALSGIEKHGALLVFPIQNRPEPLSLWSYLHPDTHMRWEWDSSSDNKVVQMWHLREELSRSGKVIYAKWFKGRATLLSKSVGAAMIARIERNFPTRSLSTNAKAILNVLEENSPLSSKILKQRLKSELSLLPKDTDRALSELWPTLQIVGFGEVDDGAFPSLAIGATRVLFEDVWTAALKMNEKEIQRVLDKLSGTQFEKYLNGVGQKSKSIKVQTELHYDELVRK